MGQGQQIERQDDDSRDRKESLKQRLKRGYAQMADLNLKLAQEGLMADREAYQRI
ncbi:hypothetical protein JCM16358_18040 [Halanaerocella petrolearia]